MATYKEIKGVTVQTRDEDPVEYVGVWSSGNNIPASGYYWASAGTQTSNIIAGGYGPGGVLNTSFKYDGTNWTAAPNINTAREQVSGFGASSTAALIVAGAAGSPFVGNTEQFDGSSWTEKNDLNTTRIQGAAAGTSYTSGIYFGGRTPPNTRKAETESWNGTSWTEVGDLNETTKASAGFGTTTAAISAGGSKAPNEAQTGVESWNGSAWTELGGTLNTGRNSMGVSGTQTAGLVFGGTPPITAKTESWDGTSFTEVNDLAQAAYGRGGSPAGTSQSALASGGEDGSPRNYTEEWSFPPVTAAILTEGQIFLSEGTTLKGFGKAAGIPTATWASGGNINTARKGSAGSGSLTTTLIFGGTLNPPTTLGETELYNGSSWTEVADLNTDRAYHGGSGTSTAALSTGGSTTGDSPITPSALNEKYDGSSWTEVGDINTARVFCSLFGGPGTTTAAILGDGYVPTSPNNYNADAVESWNGSSWSEVAEFNTPRRASGSFGTATAGIVAGGYVASPNGNVEEWDGSSFTEVADLNTPRIVYSNGFGVSTLGVIAGGVSGSTYHGNTELWNGTSWTEVNDMATGRSESGNSDSSSAGSGLVAGGREASPGAGISTTEEFTADNALSTITVS